MLRSLTCLILVIVYVGAIIILIGYICAVRPNLNLEPDFNYLKLKCFLLLTLTFFSPATLQISLPFSHLRRLSDFLYRVFGLSLFASIVTMLLITLLLVTSQYSIPRGPFRSV
jgi:hypothetical protein